MIKTSQSADRILMVSQSEFAELKQQALPIPLSTLIHGMDTLQAAMERMSRGVNQRIELEMAMVKLCTPKLDTSTEALLRRIDALERRLLSGEPIKTVVLQEPAEVAEPISSLESVSKQQPEICS